MTIKDLWNFSGGRRAPQVSDTQYFALEKNAFTSHFMLAITSKPVIIICMRIEKDYESNEEITTSQDAMSACMDQISEILIEPMLSMDMINKEQQEVLGLIATSFRILADKAQAYEDMQNGKLPQDFRN